MDMFDFVIASAQGAGCVLVRRWPESGEYTVCVLNAGNAGPADRNPSIRMLAGFVKNVTNDKLAPGFVSRPVPGYRDRRGGRVQGKASGGSGAIGGMVCNRSPGADCDLWAQCGNTGLGHADVLPHYSREVFPGATVSGDAEILDFARQYGGTAYHHTSTARMGPAGDRNAVVDPQLRVFGMEGLRVADASVMPSITSGNTNAPTIMIAEKASDMVLAAAT